MGIRKLFIALFALVVIGFADDTKVVEEVISDALTDSLITELKEYGMTMMKQEEPIQLAQSQCMGYATCWGNYFYSWGRC